MHDLKGKRALVTGGAGGLGVACARGLALRGADVVISDVSDALCESARAGLAEEGIVVSTRAFDVGQEAEVTAAFRAEDAQGGIDILVTSAAIVSVAPLLDFELETWEAILKTNLTGTFLCAQAAGRRMVERGWGRIVTVSSVNGQIANSGRGAYACSKAGVDQLTRLLAAELGPHGVTVNAVAPPPVDTPMVLKVHGPADRKKWTDQIPVGRYATPGEVASAVCFLASDEASYVNGHILNVDGGFMSTGILLDR